MAAGIGGGHGRSPRISPLDSCASISGQAEGQIRVTPPAIRRMEHDQQPQKAESGFSHTLLVASRLKLARAALQHRM